MNKQIRIKILVIVATMICIGVSLAASPISPTLKAEVPVVSSTSSHLSEENIQQSLTSVNARLSALEGSITKASDRAEENISRSASLALITVVVSGILSGGLSLLIQWLLMRHQRSMNREQSQAEVSNTYLEWQLKQLSELYGPLRALLGQSNAMYRQMNRALSEAAPAKFRLRSEEGADFDDAVFEIFHESEWTKFRTVKHIGEVYNEKYDVGPYFDDVVDVGAQMAKLIREKAGYVQHNDKELIKVMGMYLAHYSVLSRLHVKAKKHELLDSNKGDAEAVFPIAIQKLVDKGFDAINKEVMEWRSNGRKPPQA